MREAITRATKAPTEVVSEDEGDTATIEDIVCQEGSFSKGSSKRGFTPSQQFQKK